MKKNGLFFQKELRSYLLLWLTQSFSALGSGMTSFALVLWLYQTSGSALQTALTSVCSYAPYVIMSIFAGALSDRWDKKRTMLVCDLMAALSTVIILVLYKTGRLAPAHLYLLNALNGLMNTVTIFLGICVGSKAFGGTFLKLSTLKIVGLGLMAFVFGTIGGLLMGRLMCKLSKGKINPLIGSAGVSAVPMAARVSQKVGQEENPGNFLLMHAMGPNVAGVIGSAVVAGILLRILG